MMKQLNLTVNRLQWAAHNVSVGLAPLNYGLQDSEISLLTGKRELTRTEEVRTSNVQYRQKLTPTQFRFQAHTNSDSAFENTSIASIQFQF